jgi:hypothetical protein
MKMNFDPHKKAIEELMSHLGKKDDEELGEVIKPKGAGIEVTKMEASGDPEVAEEMVETSGDAMGSSEPKLSDEEIQELIDALAR